MTLQLSTQAWERLADRPRKHALVGAVWDTLADLETLGGEWDLGLVAALRFVLVHHQPDGQGRCGACRRKTARHLWRRRSWPCVVWRQVHYELIGPFAGGGHHRQITRSGRDPRKITGELAPRRSTPERARPDGDRPSTREPTAVR
ncbi:MAG: hypothetical protein GEU83_19365 [Pseudonocardiaceae bacterium]|nr:hypothetical protein [Pseudonocardiaceae bacterium]